MTKRSFSVGDRVRVFHRNEQFNGTIDSIGKSMPSNKDLLFVIEDGFYSCHNDAPFHPRQCVRLVPKKKRPDAVKEFAADQCLVGSKTAFTFGVDPNMPQDEIHLRYQGKTVAKIVGVVK